MARLSFAEERVLAVVAHPDDAELLCAGTLARARGDGAAIAICVLCRGEKGGPAEQARQLADTRRNEMRDAARRLGAEAFFGEIDDATLRDLPEHRRRLIEVYRRFAPTLVLAHAPDDYHADHRAASALAEAASWFACSPGHDTGQPPLEQPPALWWMDTVNMLGFEPGFYLDVAEQMPLKIELLACHRSQLQRADDPGFESLEQLIRRQAETRGAQAGVAAAEAFRIHPAWKRIAAW